MALPLKQIYINHSSVIDADNLKKRLLSTHDKNGMFIVDGLGLVEASLLALSNCLCCEEEVGEEDAEHIRTQLEKREKNCMWCGDDFGLTKEETKIALNNISEGELIIHVDCNPLI